MSLYTEAELVANIKEIDLTLNGGLTNSKIGTGQTDHEINLSLAQMQKQRNYYLGLLQRAYPATYKSFFGPSVINFRGHHRG